MQPPFLTLAPLVALALVLLASFEPELLLPRAVRVRAQRKQTKPRR